ncbi:cell wall-binding repeat-containing protein [Clostridium oceanicum]|uniref:D-glucuronyl C5-epimerase C-terminal domain-containing protein n=1 Tax=Clostridium oceanicum TaxID=1543 RepID=A0ABN1JUX8_9CLOT
MKKTNLMNNKIKICLFALINLIVFCTVQLVCVKPIKAKVIYKNVGRYKKLVDDGLNRFPREARDYRLFLGNYDSFGDYLNYGPNKSILFNLNNIKLDKDGNPVVLYNGKYQYNPVTLAQYSLSLYGEYLKGTNTKESFLKVTDKLMTLQNSKGAFTYNFPWRYYLNSKDYSSGWYSGMAQGQALSVFTRAYKLTKDKKYLEAGNKALKFMITPVSKGGTMDTLSCIDKTLGKNIIFEEYISNPSSYTLNGFMFSLLGLYDWSQLSNVNIDNSKISKEYFNKGISTLEKILPYYDLGGFTAYDLGFMVRKNTQPHIGVNYHGVHIYLLNALYSITQDKTLYDYYRLWKSYVDTTPVNRIYGKDRYETSISVSKKEFRNGSKTILISSGEVFADALCAAPLASKYKAPMLLSPKKSLTSGLKNEIQRLNPSNVIIIGKEGAISENVANQIKDINSNIHISRIGGEDRYETSVLIAKHLDCTSFMIAYGGNYADSISAVPIAASKNMPMLLVKNDSIPNEVNKYLHLNKNIINNSYIIGGTGVVSKDIEKKLKNVKRIGGKNRYETNTMVIKEFLSDLDLSKAYVTVGGPDSIDFADGLVASPVAAKYNAPIIIMPKNNVVLNVTKEFAYKNLKKETELIAIGGSPVIPNQYINFLKKE